MKNYFVDKESIVRTIWGKADSVLFIFAGAAAEFALNKAVDWLYFTGKLPKDPLGRLFSTVEYARKIIFAERDSALQAIDQIATIHKSVENKRGTQIPDWAYLDVLFLLIDYSVRSFELLERKLTEAEKNEIFKVFYRVGARMQLAGLPADYSNYVIMRRQYLSQNLKKSNFTTDLYKQYKKHLGYLRFTLLKQVQLLLVPPTVKTMLFAKKRPLIKPILLFYKFLGLFRMATPLKNSLLPAEYKEKIKELNYAG